MRRAKAEAMWRSSMIFRRTELASVSIAQYRSKRRFLLDYQEEIRGKDQVLPIPRLDTFSASSSTTGIDGPRRISNLRTFSKCLWPKKPNPKVRPATPTSLPATTKTIPLNQVSVKETLMPVATSRVSDRGRPPDIWRSGIRGYAWTERTIQGRRHSRG